MGDAGGHAEVVVGEPVTGEGDALRGHGGRRGLHVAKPRRRQRQGEGQRGQQPRACCADHRCLGLPEAAPQRGHCEDL